MGKPAKLPIRYDKREREVRAIIRRIQAGDANAVEELLPFYKNLIWQTINLKFGGRDDDDEAFQYALIRLWKTATKHDLQRGSKFISILKKGLDNEMIDIWRRRNLDNRVDKQPTLTEDVFRCGSEEYDRRLTSSFNNAHTDRAKDEEINQGHARRLSARYLVEDGDD